MNLFVRLVLILAIFLPTIAVADSNEVARLYSKEGVVEGKFGASGTWKLVDVGTVFTAVDTVRVGKNGRAGILFKDGMLVRIASNGSLRFNGMKNKDPELETGSGLFHFFSRKIKKYPKIKTPVVSAAIRGTEFVVDARSDKTAVSVIDGQVEVQNKYGRVLAGDGEQVEAEKGKTPTKSVLLKPFDKVQWAFFYPVVFDTSAPPKFVKNGIPAQREAWRLFHEGKISEALAAITQVPDGDKEFDAFAAQVALAVGQVDLAKKFSANDSAAAKAVRAIVALAQNRFDEALDLAKTGYDGSPDSLAAGIALSFVYQARANLEDARAVVDKLLEKSPEAGLLWARAAELALAFGEVENAEAYTLKAVAYTPKQFYPHTVRGFVKLFKNELAAATSSFKEASELSGGAALPHLGLGLVRIKQGDFQNGRLEIQKAVHLEPSSSVLRSYLGKAFFEDEEEELAANEYDLAIELDPNDPTPYLYRAFNNLSQNKVVAALEDVEASIERNENRAIYRSRLLLDQDSGVRSAGLARVFRNLGFSQAAKVEAVKSINRDYTNYSAHRLLSESNDTVFLADANLSERRVADLLAPLSFNLFNSIGGEASLNEYDALFDKDEERIGVNSVSESNDDLLNNEIFKTGKTDTTGYFASYRSTYGKGSRSNDFIRANEVRLAGQYQPVYSERFLVDGSYRYTDQDVQDAEIQETETIGYAFNIGYHKRLDARSRFIGQISLEKERDSFGGLGNRDVFVSLVPALGERTELSDTLFLRERFTDNTRTFKGEGQYIHRGDLVSHVAGFQVFQAGVEHDENSSIIDDFNDLELNGNGVGIFTDLDRTVRARANNNLHGTDFYLYSTIHAARWVDLNIGGTFTQLEFERTSAEPFVDGTFERTRFNPKFGLTLYPTADLTIRAAHFESLRKSSLLDQGALEPTLVGGINQRFNDLTGIRARTSGIGIDYKMPASSYFGVELLHRDLREETEDSVSEFTFDFGALTEGQENLLLGLDKSHQDQDVIRAYYYQVLTDHLVATVDYDYHQLQFNDPDLAQELQTHKSAVALRYFCDYGFQLFSRATWREQERTNSITLGDGVEDFWLIDLGLGYRLPKRHGLLTLEVLNLFDESFQYDQLQRFEDLVFNDLAVRFTASVNF